MAGTVFEEAQSMYIGTTPVQQVYLGQQLVWPMVETFTIMANSLSVGYYNGSTLTQSAYILADGSYVAKATANVQVYRNGTLDRTLTGVFLTPSSISGADASHFSISGQAVTGSNLGSTEAYDGYSATVSWVYGSSAAVTSTVSQQYNRASGTVTVTASYSTVPAPGTITPVTFTASGTGSWTSGATISASTSDFTFSIAAEGNSGKRTYLLDANNALTIGSMGTNEEPSRRYTYIRATYTASMYGDTILTEAPNVVTGTALNISWSIGSVPSYGGTGYIGVASAKITTTYSSGDSGNTSVSAANILNATTASGSGLTYSHTVGASTASVSAYANEGTNPTARSITLTTTYQGLTSTTTDVMQQPVAYRTKTEITSGIINAYIKNADSANAHTFNYTVYRDGAGTSGTATFSVGDDAWRAVGGMQASGHVLTITVTKQDGNDIIRQTS